MYRVFVYGYSFESNEIYITDEFEFYSLEGALKHVALFNDDDLFEIAKDVPFAGKLLDVTSLQTVARPAAMRALVNTYYSRW